MVDDQLSVRIGCSQFRGLLRHAPAQQVDRQAVLRGGLQHMINARIVCIHRIPICHHHPDSDRPFRRRPIGNGFGDAGVSRIDRLDQRETARMFGVYLQRVTRVVAVHCVRRDQQRAIDPDRIHRHHHVVAGDFGRTRKNSGPGALRAVPFVGVDLRIDGQHGDFPSEFLFREASMPTAVPHQP